MQIAQYFAIALGVFGVTVLLIAAIAGAGAPKVKR